MTIRWTIACLAILPAVARADDFDRYTGTVLASLAKHVKPVDRITTDALSQVGAVAGQENGWFVVVHTGAGNWAKAIVSVAARKSNGRQATVLVLERYVTYRAGSNEGRLARGGNVYLFDGFRFNFDIGQVVPEAQGADVQFRADGLGGTLLALDDARLLVPTRSILAPPPRVPGPTPGPTVIPTDFTGRYHLVANGQIAGVLVLGVGSKGAVTGSFVSDETGAKYPVEGQVGRPPNKIDFVVTLPRTSVEYEGYLWTKGKDAMAGVAAMADRPMGFYAVRITDNGPPGARGGPPPDSPGAGEHGTRTSWEDSSDAQGSRHCRWGGVAARPEHRAVPDRRPGRRRPGVRPG